MRYSHDVESFWLIKHTSNRVKQYIKSNGTDIKVTKGYQLKRTGD
jgi:hypothetical protein